MRTATFIGVVANVEMDEAWFVCVLSRTTLGKEDNQILVFVH